MSNTPNYYAVIPANVRYAKIKPAAKLLYGEIAALTNKKGYCYAETGYFAQLYSVSDKQIRVWISELENCKFITNIILPELGNKRLIFLGIVNKDEVITEFLKDFKQTYSKKENISEKSSLSSDQKVQTLCTKRCRPSAPKGADPLHQKVQTYIYNMNNTMNNTINKKKENKTKEKKENFFNAFDYVDLLVKDGVVTDRIGSLLRDWLEVRKAKRAPTTQKALELAITLLKKHSTHQETIIKNSILNGWTGLFPPKGSLGEALEENTEDFDSSEQKYSSGVKNTSSKELLDQTEDNESCTVDEEFVTLKETAEKNLEQKIANDSFKWSDYQITSRLFKKYKENKNFLIGLEMSKIKKEREKT